MSNMHIEDFKAKVAQFQVGDELKLEELCAEWNEEADRLAAEEAEKAQERAGEGYLDQIEALENEVDGLKETLNYREKEIGRLEGELKRLRSIIDKLLEEGVQ